MGLTTWKNAPTGNVLKSDIGTAKNYMKELERRDSMNAGDMPDLFTSVRMAEEARKPAELTDRQKALIAAAESILAVDVDSLTPREALERLYDLHQRALDASSLR